MALKGEIRTIKVDDPDVRTMLPGNFKVELSDTHCYAESNIFGGDGGYLGWPRQMRLVAPGQLECFHHGHIDYRNIVRNLLSQERYIDGLGNATLILFYGQLLENGRNGKPVFVMLPIDQADHVMIMGKWPAGRQPIYNSRADGHFVNDFNVQMIRHVEPNQNGFADQGCGYDLWVVSTESLGERFLQYATLHEELQADEYRDRWRRFELHQPYFRQQMEALLDRPDLNNQLGLKVEFREDYALMTFADPALAQAMFGEPNPEVCLWYERRYVKLLSKLLTTLSARYAVGHNATGRSDAAVAFRRVWHEFFS